MSCACRAISYPEGLGDAFDHDLSRGSPEALHGDAGCGRWSLGLHLRTARSLGWPAVHKVGVELACAVLCPLTHEVYYCPSALFPSQAACESRVNLSQFDRLCASFLSASAKDHVTLKR